MRLHDSCFNPDHKVKYLKKYLFFWVLPLIILKLFFSKKKSAKISFNIILLNLAVRIIGIFLLIDLFVFSLWWWMFDRYISIIDRKMSNTNEYFINRLKSIVWKNSIVRKNSIIKIVMVAQQRACRQLRRRHGRIKRKSLYSRFVFSD